jgi:hypothetical protein
MNIKDVLNDPYIRDVIDEPVPTFPKPVASETTTSPQGGIQG